MSVLNASVPVVALGFHCGGLGVARSLGRLGVRVHGVDGDADAPGFASRYCRSGHVWDYQGAPAADTVAFLDDLGRKVGPAVLIPTTDPAAQLIADHADDLEARFTFARVAPEVVHALVDKREVFRMARQAGVPTPPVMLPRSLDEVARFLADITFPVLLKAIDPGRLERRTGHRLFVAHTSDEVLRRYAEWEDATAPNLMLQEYIPGGDDSVWVFNGVFNERSECIAAFTGQKLRQHPSEAGAVSLGRYAPNPEIVRLTADFTRALRFRGILDIDYRFDARDGQYKLLDPNPRVGSSFRLFVDQQGMDVARLLYLDLTGQPISLAPMRVDRKWIYEDRDIETSLERLLDGTLTLRGWLTSLRGVEECAWYAGDDLRPFLQICRALVWRMVRSGVRRIGAAFVRPVVTVLRDAWSRAAYPASSTSGRAAGD
jgi:predicted ATP-grasp superfamily ATP-dependent carboligase